jgi:hypothetical protein
MPPLRGPGGTCKDATARVQFTSRCKNEQETTKYTSGNRLPHVRRLELIEEEKFQAAAEQMNIANIALNDKND